MVTGTFMAISATLTLAALAFLLLPLLRPARNDAQHERLASLEAARAAGVLEASEYTAKRAALLAAQPGASSPKPARGMALALLILTPLLAFGLYRKLGDPRAFDASSQEQAAAPAPSMDQAIAAVKQRLAERPDDLQGWLLLARAQKTLENFADAHDAFTKALELAPDSPDVMVESAEAQVLVSQEKRFDGEPLERLKAALAIDPNHQRGLWLLGVAQVQAGNSAEGVATWEKLLALLPPDAPVRQTLRQNIDQVRAESRLAASDSAASDPSPTQTPSPTSNATGPRLVIEVDIAPELKSRIQPNDTLFVFARAPLGPKMPLAIQRLSASQLPLRVELTNEQAMLPQMNLSSLAEVVVGARISRSGNAQAQPGDLETLSAPLPSSRVEPISLVIDSVTQ